jgi:hypothetical protein
LKTDDDSVVHLPRLDYWIDKKFRAELQKNPATYFGYIITNSAAVRNPNSKS